MAVSIESAAAPPLGLLWFSPSLLAWSWHPASTVR